MKQISYISKDKVKEDMLLADIIKKLEYQIKGKGERLQGQIDHLKKKL